MEDGNGKYGKNRSFTGALTGLLMLIGGLIGGREVFI